MYETGQQRLLGATGLEVSALGVGTNRWGARRGRDDEQTFQAFQASLDAGLTFFDTAEIYQRGASEILLGAYARRDRRPLVIASKFAPLVNRLSPHALMDALDASLSRLNVDTLDLYHIHWPYSLLRIDALMDMMALAVRLGKVRSVGVSNYSAAQMHQAAARLARYHIPLASNEVHYSLLHRQPETNGVLAACRELNVALIAYRPLESGLLKDLVAAPTTPGRRPRFPRPGQASQTRLLALQGLLGEIAAGQNVTVSQVALNWLLCRDEHIIPIPGSTSAHHARENAETLNWHLSAEECAAIDRASQAWKR